MTTELEEQFFKVFGIEPIPIKTYGYWLIKGSIAENDKGEKVVYPEITDRKLLEMICVLSQWDADNYYQILANNMQDLKNEILNDCINFKQKLKNKYFDAQIQQLFKGEK